MPAIELTDDEALVLFDCLSWWSATPALKDDGSPDESVPIRHNAEIDAFQSLLDKLGDVVPEPFEAGFDQRASVARSRVEADARKSALTK